MSGSSSGLQIQELEPAFYSSISFDSLTDDHRKLGDLLVTSGWHLEMRELNQNDDFTSKFSDIKKDESYYTSNNPEKRPISNSYFEKYPSVSTEYYDFELFQINEFELSRITIRVFEHGAITARCEFMSEINAMAISDTISNLRELRIQARREIYDAVSEFVNFIDEVYHVDISLPDGRRELDSFEQYEYLNTVIVDPDSEHTININNLKNSGEKQQELKELVAFCRMTKEYHWPKFPRPFLRDFIDQDLGNRKDSLWFVTSQRFIRHFPDRNISETTQYAKDVSIAVEVLLSLRSTYKSLIEKVNREVGDLPDTISSKNNPISSDISRDDIQRIQEQISTLSFRTARIRLPSNIRFYAQSPFAAELFIQVEKELQLPELSDTLERETEKFRAVLDSFSNIITHRRDVALQRHILILTIVVTLVGLSDLLLSVL